MHAPTDRPPRVRAVRRLVTTAALAASLAAGLAVVPVVGAPSAAADEGLDETTRSRYELRASAGEVRAVVTTTIRNATPAQGNLLYYYDRYGIPLPAGATDVRATSAGTALPVQVRGTEDPSTAVAVASFPSLYYGSTRTIEWSFLVPGEPVRSEDDTRVGRGYATFTVQASGDPGQVSVEVVLPSAMTFDATLDGFTSERHGRTTTYRATQGVDAQGVWAVVSARDPRQVDERRVTAGGATLTLQGFPGDERWLRFAERGVGRGVPALEDVVGHEWPGGLDMVREDVSPQARGYAWFDAGSDEIVVPEDLDAALLFHELSHAWFNPDEIAGRWLYEGLAEVVAHRVADDVGAEGSAPRPVPDRDSAAALPLTAWAEAETSAEVEQYAYAASSAAVGRLLRGLDDETFTRVVAAAYAGESAYEAPGDTGHHRARTQWRRFLDLVEVRGGVTGAAKVYRTWVLDGRQRGELRARAAARADYAALDEADGAWRPPLGLRAEMTEWSFDDAARITSALRDAPALAGEVQDAARDAGVRVPAVVRAAYEDANDADAYAALGATLPQAVRAVTAVGEATTAAGAERDLVSALGAAVLALDPAAQRASAALDAGDLGAAEAGADGVQARAGWATWTGIGLVLAVLVVLGGAVGGVAVARRRRGARAVPP
ncbi:hypothetical protein GCM10009809_33500 [Isoptericola hypogeus]|uniref:Peptidase MA superfamily protein n=1 Tax=Isoptericola hypogeus TaxID=300179 RepID=A0ABN2JQM4_9MICO